jgi:hypothetical protein
MAIENSPNLINSRFGGVVVSISTLDAGGFSLTRLRLKQDA